MERNLPFFAYFTRKDSFPYCGSRKQLWGDHPHTILRIHTNHTLSEKILERNLPFFAYFTRKDTIPYCGSRKQLWGDHPHTILRIHTNHTLSEKILERNLPFFAYFTRKDTTFYLPCQEKPSLTHQMFFGTIKRYRKEGSP